MEVRRNRILILKLNLEKEGEKVKCLREKTNFILRWYFY